MNQNERRIFLIRALLAERPDWNIGIPTDEEEQKRLLRSLMNVRMPAPISDEILSVQDAYLQEETRRKGITNAEELFTSGNRMAIWQGDITTLRCGAIVNAANSGMTGCYSPCHNCIDNCIHTYAGIRLRLKCAELMNRQGYEEPTGQAKITPGYDLPCDYVIHTVGPIVQGRLTKRHEELLASCYTSCLNLAAENGVESIAFCCISTGVFMFPNQRAAEIAVQTVTEWQEKTGSAMKVIFNVFKDEDRRIYQKLLNERH